MNSLLDLRRSRLSLTILIALSALATFVILSGGHGRTHAEMAALAALHERPATRTVVVAAAPAAPAGPAGRAGSNSATPTGDNGSGAGSPATPSPSPVSANTSDSAGTDTGGDTTTTNGSSTSNTTTTATTPSAVSDLPKVGHVFEIALSTTDYKATFAHGSAPYLHSLERKGTLLRGYHSLGSSELADNLAMISGQAPNPDTRGGCTTYAEFPTAVVAKANGLVPGRGCVYPETALTLGDQVSSSGHNWRAYLEDQGKQACVHANSNAVDDLPLPGADPGYDSRHNPFIYFHSLLDLGDCATNDLGLSRLPAALSSTSTTATFSFLAPSACGDARAIANGATATTGPTSTGPTSTDPTGTDPTTTSGSSTTPTTSATTTTRTTTTPTAANTTTVSGALGSPTAAACPAGPVGIAAENAFLKSWVPLILRSPAYKKDGVLVIAVSGDGAKRSGPHVPTGALVLSRYVRKDRVIAAPYSPYSLLRSLEDMLRYTPLAKARSAPSFASAVLRKLN